MGSMSLLQTPTSSSRDAVSAAQKKKGIKSSLGRFFSKKDKVILLLFLIFQYSIIYFIITLLTLY